MQQLIYFQLTIFQGQEDRRNGRLYHHEQLYQYSLQLAIVQCTIVIIPRRITIYRTR